MDGMDFFIVWWLCPHTAIHIYSICITIYKRILLQMTPLKKIVPDLLHRMKRIDLVTLICTRVLYNCPRASI